MLRCIIVNNKLINIWDERCIYKYGTKQRVSAEFIKTKIKNYDEITVIDNKNIELILWSCIEANIKLKVFTDTKINLKHQLLTIKPFNNITTVDYYGPKQYHLNNDFIHQEFIIMLYKDIIEDPLYSKISPKRMWIPTYSPLLILILRKLFPKTILIGIYPPYYTCDMIDIKYESNNIWELISNYAENDDYVWDL